MKEYNQVDDIIAKALIEEDLTPEEIVQLNDWLKDEKNKELFDELKDKENLIGELALHHQFDIATGRQIVEQKKERHRVIKLSWYRYTAAASIVLVLLSAVVWFHKTNDKKLAKAEEKAVPVVHDAAPGKYNAKLILADGSVVVLDTANNKPLGHQGGTSIVNENGKLVYKGKPNTGKVLYNTLITGKGEMYPLVLADGSRLWLNSESSVRYPVSVPQNQEIDVTVTGEVFFEIVHNPKRKFTITVNGMNITDIGTRFNINAYPDEDNIKVTLVEGAVSVKKGDKIVLLKRGQQAVAQKMQNDNSIKVIDDADTEKAIAWKNGQFEFNKDDLKTVMRQLARWYDLDVVYEGNVPKGQFIGTVPRNLNLSQVLEILASSDVHFKIAGKKLIVTP
jgi:ferric-dicitrate binding protein FerR (iron transport regulator)